MKNLTINFNISVKESMEILDKTAEKVLLVVDAHDKLLGALTDGDIRRHILKGNSLSGTIENAYNKNPYYVYQKNFDWEVLKNAFAKHKLNLIPVVNQEKKIVDYITLTDVFGGIRKNHRKKLTCPVVIMAGGKGTRLKPFTKILPKPLIPVGEKTILDHIIDRFRMYQIKDYHLTINYMSKIIQAYFEEKNPEYTIQFTQEKEPRGTAGSLKLINTLFKSPFFVSNCDIIIEADYHDIFNFHKNGNYDITMVAAAKQFNIPYGVCHLNNSGCLHEIKEKPGYNFLVNTGFYVLNPDVIDMIPERGEYHMTHLMEKIKETKGTIGVYPISENAWIDVGQWEEYHMALKKLEGLT